MDTKNKSRGTVLVSIVDDDDLMRRSTRRLLRSAGFWAEAFSSAEEFLTSENLEETACLILDLRMPGMDGLQLQRKLTEDGHRILIIFISAHDKHECRAEAMRGGAIDFLLKPYAEKALLCAIGKAVKSPPNNE